MSDRVVLKVYGFVFEHYIEYSIESSLYQAGDAFAITLPPNNAALEVGVGDPVEVWVNNELELSGLVDRIDRGYGKQGRHYRIEGRDLQGLVVDSYVTGYQTLQDKTLRQVAEELLADVPRVDLRNIEYEDDAESEAVAAPFAQIEPGMTIFDTLKELAMSRGLMFWCRANGAMVFGRPKRSGQARHAIYVRGGENRHNVIEARRVEDVSQRWSSYTVMGQQQGAENTSASNINVAATIDDDSMPVRKPYVELSNTDAESPSRQARLVMERQRAYGDTLTYTVHGHAQRDRNWRINELCAVEDDYLDVYRDLLVVNRRFTMNDRDGFRTELQLSEPGVIA